MLITPTVRAEGADLAFGMVWTGSAWTEKVQPLTDAQHRATMATLAVTATAAAAAGVTLTLPAVAGAFHYLTWLQIVMYSSAARTGNATPVLVTTSNWPGTQVFTFPSAGAVGTITVQEIEPAMPLRSNVLNTATTIVCPATASVIWRINAHYFAGV